VAPATAGFDFPITEDLRKKLVEYYNDQCWITDTTSKSEGRYFHVPFETQKNPHLKEIHVPMVPVGANRAVLPHFADRIQKAFFAFGNDITNLFINATNFVKAQIWEQKVEPNNVPTPTLGIPIMQFYEYIEEVKKVNKDFFKTGPTHTFNPIPNESAFWPSSRQEEACDVETTSTNNESQAEASQKESGEEEDSDVCSNSSSTRDMGEENNQVQVCSKKDKEVSVGGDDVSTSESSAKEQQEIGDGDRDDNDTFFPANLADKSPPDMVDNELTDDETPSTERKRSICPTTGDRPRKRIANSAARLSKICTFIPNQCINVAINAGERFCGSYSWHQDAALKRGHQLTSPAWKTLHTKPWFPGGAKFAFPCKKHMLVSTFIFGDDDMTAKTTVDWAVKEVTHSWLGGFVTARNNAHFQLIGVQYFLIVHCAAAVPNTRGHAFKGCRLICTLRFTADPNRETHLYLNMAYQDNLLPLQIQKRKGLTVLFQPDTVNAISEPMLLGNGANQDAKTRLAKYMNWEEACSYQPVQEDHLFPPGLHSNRKGHKVSRKYTFRSLNKAQLGYFQMRLIPIRDNTDQTKIGFPPTLLSQDLQAFYDSKKGNFCSNENHECNEEAPHEGCLKNTSHVQTEFVGVFDKYEVTLPLQLQDDSCLEQTNHLLTDYQQGQASDVTHHHVYQFEVQQSPAAEKGDAAEMGQDEDFTEGEQEDQLATPNHVLQHLGETRLTPVHDQQGLAYQRTEQYLFQMMETETEDLSESFSPIQPRMDAEEEHRYVQNEDNVTLAQFRADAARKLQQHMVGYQKISKTVSIQTAIK
jgi:hypothetical protein